MSIDVCPAANYFHQMNQTVLIEHYLLQLDRALQPLTVSERAEIITEMKAHILEVISRDPKRETQAVLREIGPAAVVAGRFLAGRGFTPPKRYPFLRWMAFGTAGFFALIFICGLAAVWYLSPLVSHFGEKIEGVRIGGLGVGHQWNAESRVRGETDTSLTSVSRIRIPFNTAKIEVKSGTDKLFKWNCKAVTPGKVLPQIVAGILTFNLDELNLVKCSFILPKGVSSEFHGVNGHMEVESPHDAMNISLTNGRVEVHPDKASVYDFDVDVKNGLQDFFPRSTDKQAVKVKIDVLNGLVKKE